MTAPPILYATPEQACADAQRFGDTDWLRTTHTAILRLVSNPRANSDALLLLADDLRRFGADEPFRTTKPGAADCLLAWANTLTDLAPTRANPIEDAA